MDGLLSIMSVTEYNGYKVKEWNIVQFSKLSGVINAIAKKYIELNLSWDKFSDTLSKASDTGLLGVSTGLMDALQPFLEYSPALLSVSCGVTEKQLEDMKFTDGVILTMLVIKANMEHLNGFFANLAAQIGAAGPKEVEGQAK